MIKSEDETIAEYILRQFYIKLRFSSQPELTLKLTLLLQDWSQEDDPRKRRTLIEQMKMILDRIQEIDDNIK